MEVGKIIQGTVNSIFNINQEMSKNRLQICYACPLYKKGVCNRKLWLNPVTNDVSPTKKEGYVRGCGCALSSKTRVPTAKCVAGKW